MKRGHVMLDYETPTKPRWSREQIINMVIVVLLFALAVGALLMDTYQNGGFWTE